MSECSTLHARPHPHCPTPCGGTHPTGCGAYSGCGAYPWTNANAAWPCGSYVQPICTSPAQYPSAETAASGATLVIHQLVLEPCGNPSCTPRTFKIRITGPSYPCGEVFTLTAGNCLSLDEPLVLTGLEPGTYCIEEIFACPNAYISTYTGPVCGRCVNITGSRFPTVITICCRKRLCRLCHGYGCGCSACGACR